MLIDDGSDSLDRQALAALPFAVSFALDPTNPKAAEHAAIYRAAGQEVVMLATALPAGAQAADVEVALAAMAQALPESVAVMDLRKRPSRPTGRSPRWWCRWWAARAAGW